MALAGDIALPMRAGRSPRTGARLGPEPNVAWFPPWLVFDLGAAHRLLSWAVVGGGPRTARRVAWLQVRNDDLHPGIEPRDFVARQIEALPARRRRELSRATILLTSAQIDGAVDEVTCASSLTARCIATVGLGNALRVGAPPTPMDVGTINLVCRVSAPLSPTAMIEALAIAVEARTAAVIDARIPTASGGKGATGTGTDCAVIAAPPGSPALPYAGKHTAVGSLIGAAVYAAIEKGIERWQAAAASAASRSGS
jgi:adenosylcobinamide amidohydrolase